MQTMRKKEFLQQLAEKFPDLSEVEVTRAGDKIFNELIAAMRRGERAELRGFGTFYTSWRKTRLLRGPRTGRTVEIPARRLPRFKAGKELKQKVNAARPS